MEYKFKPIVEWSHAQTKNRQRSAFKAGYEDTLKILDREIAHLSARNPVIIQTHHATYDIRLDGLPRANAGNPQSPAVIVTFEIFIFSGKRNEQGQRLGNYRYVSFPCDRFTDWKDNLRAIALSLEALRKVDRYGVTRSGEQYKGWAAIPATSDSTQQNAEFISLHSDVTADQILSSKDDLAKAYRKAALRLHPDVAGGNEELFKRLQQARHSVEQSFIQ